MAWSRIEFLFGVALAAGLSAAASAPAASAPAASAPAASAPAASAPAASAPAASAPAASRALDASAAAACFAQHPPTVVSSLEGDQVAGDGSYTSLVGAQLFVPAEPGLTAEWLNYQYRERLANRQASDDCPLDVAGLNVSVQSAGPGFWVQLSASDESTAKEVLRRARLWVPPGGAR